MLPQESSPLPDAISLETLVQNVQQKPNSASIQQFCTNAIRVRLAENHDDEPPRKMLERIVHAAVQATITHVEDPGVMVEACTLLAERLCAPPGLARQTVLGVCVSDDAIGTLCTVLAQHLKISKVVVLCCECLDVLVPSTDKVKKDRRSAAAATLLQAIAEHAHDSSVAKVACKTAAIILGDARAAGGPGSSTASHPVDDLVVALKGVAAAKGKAAEKPLQLKGLAALAALGTFQEFRSRLVTNGAVDIPVALSQKSTSDVEMTLACIGVWAQLARMPEGQVALRQCRAISLIVAIMKKHTALLTHQLEGTSALGALVENDDNKLDAAASGAIEILVSAAKAHQGSSELQAAVAEVFNTLALSERNRVLIGAKGGVAILLDAARKLGVTEVIRPVAQALHRLVEHEDNAAVLGDKGGTQTLIGILTEVPDAQSHQAAAGALAYIARDSRGCQAIFQAEGLAALISSLQTHVADKTVLRTVCDAIWRVVYINDRHNPEEVGMTLALAEQGGVEPVCEAMGRFTGDFSVQLPCCGILNQVSSLAKTHVLLLGANAVGLLVASQKQHLASPELQAEAAGALRRLCHSPNGR